MYLLAASRVHPERGIESSFLEALGGGEPTEREKELAEKIQFRPTTLPLDYIEETKNTDPRAGEKAALESGTTLAIEAAKKIFEQSGVAPEEVGLILGGSATPHQTIPTEAQRVAGGLGIKTSAYDINGSSGDIALQLSTLLKWREDRLPDYILCISTNTPTQRIDYSSGVERAFLSDGAVAMLFSPRKESATRVLSASYQTQVAKDFNTQVRIYGHVELSSPDFFDYISDQQAIDLEQALSSSSLSGADISFIDNHYPFTISQKVYDQGVQESRHINMLESYGCSFSATPYMVLCDSLNDLASGTKVAVASAGLGSGTGMSLFEIA